MREILQSQLPDVLRESAVRPLPGMQPLSGRDWICVDEAYEAQLALKAQLLARRRDEVLITLPEGRAAAEECLDEVVALLQVRADFTVSRDRITRPDGVALKLDRADPLASIASLLQEDICILVKTDAGYVLCAALLCFPASWTLGEKIGRPMGPIHGPVVEYDTQMDARVTRLFDNVRVGEPMWRANCLRYADAALFQPRAEAAPRRDEGPARFERAERQTIWRLPRSGAVVFSIHTTTVRL